MPCLHLLLQTRLTLTKGKEKWPKQRFPFYDFKLFFFLNTFLTPCTCFLKLYLDSLLSQDLYIYIYTELHTHTYIHTHTHTLSYMYIYIHTQIRIYIYIYIYIVFVCGLILSYILILVLGEGQEVRERKKIFPPRYISEAMGSSMVDV